MKLSKKLFDQIVTHEKLTEDFISGMLSNIKEQESDRFKEKQLAPGGDFDKFADLLVESPGFQKIWDKIASTLLAKAGE